MCEVWQTSMADIQSPTAEIRRGKKRRKKEETTGQKYNGLTYSIGQTITLQVTVLLLPVL